MSDSQYLLDTIQKIDAKVAELKESSADEPGVLPAHIAGLNECKRLLTMQNQKAFKQDELDKLEEEFTEKGNKFTAFNDAQFDIIALYGMTAIDFFCGLANDVEDIFDYI